MNALRFALGTVGLLTIAGAMLAGGLALRRRLLPAWHGAEARLAEALLAIALLVAILEALGTVRLFRALLILVVCLAVGFVAARRLRGGAHPARPRWDLPALAALAAGLVVGAEWLIPTLDSLDHGIRTLDTLWYHLPWAASYAQSGEITSLRFTDVEYLTAFYPATAEVLHGLGIVILGRDTLSPLLNLGWLAFTLLAAWCAGAPRGRGAASVLAVAVVLATPMMNLSQAGSAANDIVGIAFLMTAVALARRGEGEPAADGLAALAAGLAVGTKLSLAIPALALALAVVASRRGRAGLWAGGLGLGGGFWYARNLVAVGNPVPWVDLPGLATPAPPLQAPTGFSVAHYLGSGRFWSHFAWPGLHAGLGLAWPAILLLAILAPLVLLLRPGPGRILGAVALLALAGYVVTPESAAGPAGDPVAFAFNLRYSAPALVLCLSALALLGAPPRPGGSPRAVDAAITGLLAVLLALTLARSETWPARHAAAAVVIALLAGALAVVAPQAWETGRRHRRPAAVGAALVLIAATAGGYAIQRDYLRHRYGVTRVSQMSPVWNLFRRIHHARVAVVGTYGGFFAYPLSGLDLSDRVSYIGARGPHGSFTPITGCRRWRKAINAGHYDLLVATPARDPWHPRRLQPSPEAGWTEGDPAAAPVLRRRRDGATIVVLRLRGPLDARACG